MPNNYFKFKQFTILQEKSAMKVGTDGVLLGAWADIGEAKAILDIGTGTGLIAIMLAQRSGATIDAVEIDSMSALQAKENVSSCSWAGRITVVNKSFQDFYANCSKRYDLIVSNPPYFIKSHKSPSAERSVARHTDELPYDDLLKGVVELLTQQGRFAGIFPYVEGNIFIAKAATHGLYCNKRVNVLGKKNGSIKRLLLEFGRSKQPLTESSLAIRCDKEGYTPEYKELTEEFYLNIK